MQRKPTESKVYKEKLYLAYRPFSKYHRLPIEGYDLFCKLVKRKLQYGGINEGRDSSDKRKPFWKGIQIVKWESTDPEQDVLTV
jgi:hypothetical protein